MGMGLCPTRALRAREPRYETIGLHKLQVKQVVYIMARNGTSL